MKRARVIALFLALAAAVLVQGPMTTAARPDVVPQRTARTHAAPYIGTRPASNPQGIGAAGLPAKSTSTNWSGYAVQTSFPTGASGSVTDAKASWVVPTVTGGTTDAYSADWVGIDGYSSPSVEQIGTEQDWIGGSQLYYAWWEMYPDAEVLIPSISVSPGDLMNAEVRWITGDEFSLTLNDVTKGQTFTTVQTVVVKGGAQLRSAEWIVEAPASGTTVLPFAKPGPSSFTSCSVTVNGTTGTISGAGWQYDPIVLTAGTGGVTLATPSALTAGGSAFVVTAPGTDLIAPTTSSDATASYDNVAVIHLTATDNVGGSGVAATHYQVDGGPTQTGSVVTVSTYGAHSLTFWSVDGAGNAEVPHSVSFMVNDTIPPTTSSDVVGAYFGTAVIHLTPVDNPGGSGVAVTHYTVDGVFRQAYTAPISVTATGTHTLTFWSVDNAGNVESTHSATFSVTAQQPTLLSLKASASSLTKGKYVGLSSTLSGGIPAGTIVRYEVSKPGSSTFVLVATRAVNGSGASSYRYKLTLRGYYHFRVRFLGTPGFTASISPVRQVRSR